VSELKPCPFCGSADVMAVKDWAFCTRCHATAYRWNNRAPEPEPTEAQRDLEAMKQQLITRESLRDAGYGGADWTAVLRTVIRLAEKILGG